MTVLVTSFHPREARARWRTGRMHDFCIIAPDFCTFVCTDPEGCWNLPDGMVCESRRGTLIVSEGEGTDGGTTSYHTSYSLCWYPAGPGTNWQPPDPEMSYVPEWPGSVTAAMCLRCRTKQKWCEKKVKTGADNCVELHKRRYKRKCESEIRKHDFPKDRFGKPLKPRSKRCERIIQLDVDLTETDTRTDPLTRKRLLAEVRKCKAQLAKECVAEFEEDHPETATANAPFRISIKDYVSFDIGETEEIRWGASTGFSTACDQAAIQATTVCAAQKTECQVKMDPDRHCR